MDRYKFVLNDFAARMFHLEAGEYHGYGVTDLLEKLLGKANYEQFMIAQDPFAHGKKEGDIRIILNRHETDPSKFRYETIGTISIVSPKPIISKGLLKLPKNS